MGWKDARLSLLAPGWELVEQESIPARSKAGSAPPVLLPVRVCTSRSFGLRLSITEKERLHNRQ